MQQQKVKLNIIFVCTGNTCRSPMAEFMFKAYLKEKKRYSDFAVSSAGLYADRHDTMSKTAHEALDVLGIKHNPERKARPFTIMMADDSDIVVAMSNKHAEICGDCDVVSFERFIGKPVSDPFGGSLDAYLACAADIRSAFDGILAFCDGLLKSKIEKQKGTP